MLTTVSALAFALALGAADPPDVDARMPAHDEEIFVVGDGPFIAPVPPGQPVRVVFSVGELEVEAQPVSEVRAHIEVRCNKAKESRCNKVRRKLRVEPKQTEEGLEVRLTGVGKYLMRRLHIEGRVVVPYDSPLMVKAGIGDVDVHGGSERLAVRMGIGDLRVHAPESAVRSVRVRTRIGDAGLRTSSGYRPGGRVALIGAGLRWSDGEGSESIDVRLRIGDARVILE